MEILLIIREIHRKAYIRIQRKYKQFFGMKFCRKIWK